jgi:hypothetical protein
MTATVCICARTLEYLNGGGHLWVYLNWALGLRALGINVIWLEIVDPSLPVAQLKNMVEELKSRLFPFGLDDSIKLCPLTNEPISFPENSELLNLEILSDADLLLNISYATPKTLVKRFRRTALLDIDPGLTQIWLSQGLFNVTPHDVYFTIGETVGKPEANFPDCGLNWNYTPPCIALDWWPVVSTAKNKNFCTISQWQCEEWIGDAVNGYRNDKREGFLPYLQLPKYTKQSLELALCLSDDLAGENDRAMLQNQGWKVRDAWKTLSTPQDYQRYIQNSLGEFSCCKPSCVRLQNAWISDRTLCYLASGKPAVVQHTGPSRFLPDAAGLFRFKCLKESTRYLETVVADYDRQCQLARALAEEYFDAKKVVKRVLELALS